MDAPAIERTARGLLDRYLVEIVERFELCPWARPARTRGEVRAEILITPARLVPCLRRSPDPMLQVVRWSALESARRAPPPPDRATQLQWLAGQGAPPAPLITDEIELANHRTISAVGMAAFEEAIAALAAARAAAYGL